MEAQLNQLMGAETIVDSILSGKDLTEPSSEKK